MSPKRWHKLQNPRMRLDAPDAKPLSATAVRSALLRCSRFCGAPLHAVPLSRLALFDQGGLFCCAYLVVVGCANGGGGRWTMTHADASSLR